MKIKHLIITTASAAATVVFTVSGQVNSTNSTGTATDYMRQYNHGTAGPIERIGRADKASELIGMSVKNGQNEKLGKISDIAVDMGSGRIVYVILSSGGFMGIDATLHAVPPGLLNHDVTNKVVYLSINQEKLAAAPKFKMASWADDTGSNHVATVYDYYGQPSYFMVRSTGLENTNTMSPRYREEVASLPRLVLNNEYLQLGYVEKASKLMGMKVMNLQDERLGKVKNLMLDFSTGRVIGVVISSGSYLGMDGELSAVPPMAFRFNAEHNVLQLNASKYLLSHAPHFTADQWPDIGQPSYAYGMYHAYGVEPYFSTNTVAGADNTGRNLRDRDGNTLTPFNQGNNQSDVDVTAQIRKEVIASDGMSMDGQNVKIITINGHVTLRGPVDTAAEKSQIGDIAVSIVGQANVNNQLEITASNGK